MYYKFISRKLTDVTLHASDTDSYFVSAEGDSERDIISKLTDIMDYSSDPDLKWLNPRDRAKIPGFLKSEVAPDKRIYEAVFLRSKLYSLKVIFLFTSFDFFSYYRYYI